MVSSAAVNEQLCALSAALDEPGTNLHASLVVLVDDLSAAVSSFLGLRMTLQSAWCPVTLMAVDPELTLSAGGSLALPLAPTAARPCGTIVLYAAHPGAFVDLAADLERVIAPGGRVVLDGDLPSMFATAQRSEITGLAELSLVNQAIGVLITRGWAPDQAQAELRSRAANGLNSVAGVARQVLASIPGAPRL